MLTDNILNHSAPPTISIIDYLHRIVHHTTLEASTLLSMIYYIDLLSNEYPAFTISSLTVHRFLITAAAVASKGLCDSFCTNTFYAKVGGVSLRELNVLELEFLNRVHWRIVPRTEILGEYYVSLVKRMGEGWGLEDEEVEVDGEEEDDEQEQAEQQQRKDSDVDVDDQQQSEQQLDESSGKTQEQPGSQQLHDGIGDEAQTDGDDTVDDEMTDAAVVKVTAADPTVEASAPAQTEDLEAG